MEIDINKSIEEAIYDILCEFRLDETDEELREMAKNHISITFFDKSNISMCLYSHEYILMAYNFWKSYKDNAPRNDWRAVLFKDYVDGNPDDKKMDFYYMMLDMLYSNNPSDEQIRQHIIRSLSNHKVLLENSIKNVKLQWIKESISASGYIDYLKGLAVAKQYLHAVEVAEPITDPIHDSRIALFMCSHANGELFVDIFTSTLKQYKALPKHFEDAPEAEVLPNTFEEVEESEGVLTANESIVKEALQYIINYKDRCGEYAFNAAYQWGVVFRILADMELCSQKSTEFCEYVSSLNLNYREGVNVPTTSSISRVTNNIMSGKEFDSWMPKAGDTKENAIYMLGCVFRAKIKELQG